MDDGWHWFWTEVRHPEIDVYCKAVWMIVKAHQYKDHWTKPIPLECFMKAGPMGKTKVAECISVLEKCGYLQVRRRGMVNGKDQSSCFRTIRPQVALFDPKSNPALYPEREVGSNGHRDQAPGEPGPGYAAIHGNRSSLRNTVSSPHELSYPLDSSVKKDSAPNSRGFPKTSKQTQTKTEIHIGAGPPAPALSRAVCCLRCRQEYRGMAKLDAWLRHHFCHGDPYHGCRSLRLEMQAIYEREKAATNGH